MDFQWNPNGLVGSGASAALSDRVFCQYYFRPRVEWGSSARYAKSKTAIAKHAVAERSRSAASKNLKPQ